MRVIMKRHLLFSLAASASVAAFGQYSIGWYRVGGASSSSSGGEYVVTGTLGHATDSAPTNGDGYAVTAGFWAFDVIRTPGEPRLTIVLNPDNTVAISWSATPAGYALEQSADLNTWAPPPESVSDNGANRFIVVSPGVGTRFYRLKRP